MFDITVIGAGISGALTALKLPKNYSVLLIEAGDEILPITSSSYNECYKLHTGVHYMGDFETAKTCLLNSIEFAREFPHLIAGAENLLSPWRRGRHYIMSNSLVTNQQARDVSIYLKEIYDDLVKEDINNKVFGEPNDFIRFLEKNDYSYLADQIPFFDCNGVQYDISVTLGIETAESQIDIEQLKKELQNKILTRSNITFVPYNKVIHIAHNPNEFGYIITTENKFGKTRKYTSETLVNCTWQNSETLDNKIGVYVPDEYRVNRIKVSILVELPECLKNMNTCIFSSGPYCSITVLPNGTAVLTSERTTNIGHIKAGVDCPSMESDLIQNKLKLDHPEGKKIAQKIKEECASYLSSNLKNELINAPIKELHVGFVKLINNEQSYDYESIYSVDSVIHARQHNGIEIRDLGYISNSGMKMTYSVGNSNIVSQIIQRHHETIEKIKKLAIQIKSMLIPLPTPINHQEKHINSLLFITYRERLIQLVSSKDFLMDIKAFALPIANEIVNHLIKIDKINKSILQSRTIFKEKIQEKNSNHDVKNINQNFRQ